MDDGSVNAMFRSQLPLRVTLLGHAITFSRNEAGKIKISIAEDAEDRFETTRAKWENRKGYYSNGPDERDNFARMAARIHNHELIRSFVLAYLATPIGLRMMLIPSGNSFEDLTVRKEAFDEAYLTWDALTNWERTPKGKLKLSIPCAGFRAKPTRDEFDCGTVMHCLCAANVVDLSACCPAHRKPTSRTLFNHYPFFEREGQPELSR